MKLFNLLRKGNHAGGQSDPPAKRKEGSAMQNDFAKSVNLEDKFEDMFENEIPDEVKYYDIHGNEVQQ